MDESIKYCYVNITITIALVIVFVIVAIIAHVGYIILSIINELRIRSKAPNVYSVL